MRPTSFLDQIDRVKSQLVVEQDWATRCQMKKTIRCLYKEYRRSISVRTPWYGLKRNSIFLLLVVGVLASLFLVAERIFGLWPASVAVLFAILALVIVTGMVLVLKKVISQDVYRGILTMCIGALNGIRDKISGKPV